MVLCVAACGFGIYIYIHRAVIILLSSNTQPVAVQNSTIVLTPATRGQEVVLMKMETFNQPS